MNKSSLIHIGLDFKIDRLVYVLKIVREKKIGYYIQRDITSISIWYLWKKKTMLNVQKRKNCINISKNCTGNKWMTFEAHCIVGASCYLTKSNINKCVQYIYRYVYKINAFKMNCIVRSYQVRAKQNINRKDRVKIQK